MTHINKIDRFIEHTSEMTFLEKKNLHNYNAIVIIGNFPKITNFKMENDHRNDFEN